MTYNWKPATRSSSQTDQPRFGPLRVDSHGARTSAGPGLRRRRPRNRRRPAAGPHTWTPWTLCPRPALWSSRNARLNGVAGRLTSAWVTSSKQSAHNATTSSSATFLVSWTKSPAFPPGTRSPSPPAAATVRTSSSARCTRPPITCGPAALFTLDGDDLQRQAHSGSGTGDVRGERCPRRAG